MAAGIGGAWGAPSQLAGNMPPRDGRGRHRSAGSSFLPGIVRVSISPERGQVGQGPLKVGAVAVEAGGGQLRRMATASWVTRSWLRLLVVEERLSAISRCS